MAGNVNSQSLYPCQSARPKPTRFTPGPALLHYHQVHGAVEPFWLVVEDADGEVVLFHQYWLLRRSLAEEEHSLSFTVPVSEPLPPQYFVRMMSDRWIGCEATLAVSFR